MFLDYKILGEYFFTHSVLILDSIHSFSFEGEKQDDDAVSDASDYWPGKAHSNLLTYAHIIYDTSIHSISRNRRTHMLRLLVRTHALTYACKNTLQGWETDTKRSLQQYLLSFALFLAIYWPARHDDIDGIRMLLQKGARLCPEGMRLQRSLVHVCAKVSKRKVHTHIHTNIHTAQTMRLYSTGLYACAKLS